MGSSTASRPDSHLLPGSLRWGWVPTISRQRLCRRLRCVSM